MNNNELYKARYDSLENFIEYELRANRGSSTIWCKEKIIKLFTEVYPNEKIKKTSTKEELIDKILEKKSILDIYEENSSDFGIHPTKWITKFNLTKTQREKMVEKKFLLEIAYKSYQKVFTSTYEFVPYYVAKPYFETDIEEVEKWKEDNIKGYKNRKK